MTKLRIEGHDITKYNFFVCIREDPDTLIEQLEIVIQPIQQEENHEDIYDRARRWADESNERRNG